MNTVAHILAEWSSSLKYEDIPRQVVADIRLRVLDSLGIQLASHTLPATQAAVSLVRRWGGREEATLTGCPDRLPASAAALANGVMAHSFDYDDTHTPTLIHPSAVIIPAAIAAAEAAGLDGEGLVVCAVAGFEVALNLGLASPGRFHNHGFHTTALLGTFGAAAAGARALGLDARQTVHALGIAGSQASGLLQSLVDGTWAKMFQCGWAAHAGLVAAELAALGFTGPSEVFEGRFGVYPSHLLPQEFDISRVAGSLGKEWQTPIISFKLYPACHHVHSFLDALADLKAQCSFSPSEVSDVVCRVAPEQVPIVCEPRAEKLQPATDYGARFSLPFAVAAGICLEDQGLDAFSPERIRDSRLLELAARVRYEVAPVPGFPRVLPADIRITLRDGRTLSASRSNCRGPHGESIQPADVERKFRGNARRVLAGDQVEAIIAEARGLEHLDSVTRLMGLGMVQMTSGRSAR